MLDKNKTIVFWGTYDKGKPRVRLLISGLKSQGINVVECHSDVWKGIEDKSQFKGFNNKLNKILAVAFAYPKLIVKYFNLPDHQTVVISYMGQLDVLIFWLINRIQKKKIVWDLFISLYDTVVVDRKMTKSKSVLARLLFFLEWLGVRAATTVFMDTETHAEYIEDLYGIKNGKIKHVFVGAEIEKFYQPIKFKKIKKFTVLFYGQFIPLHGIDTIVHAAKILEDKNEDISWIMIGKGQEQKRIDQLIIQLGIKSIKRISWIPYEKLIHYIHEVDVCLGVFNKDGKATRVIPNKVYQILSAGKPLITGDTPAIRELLEETDLIKFVEPGSSEKLTEAVLEIKERIDRNLVCQNGLNPIRIGPDFVGNQLLQLLDN